MLYIECTVQWWWIIQSYSDGTLRPWIEQGWTMDTSPQALHGLVWPQALVKCIVTTLKSFVIDTDQMMKNKFDRRSWLFNSAPITGMLDTVKDLAKFSFCYQTMGSLAYRRLHIRHGLGWLSNWLTKSSSLSGVGILEIWGAACPFLVYECLIHDMCLHVYQICGVIHMLGAHSDCFT